MEIGDTSKRDDTLLPAATGEKSPNLKNIDAFALDLISSPESDLRSVDTASSPHSVSTESSSKNVSKESREDRQEPGGSESCDGSEEAQSSRNSEDCKGRVELEKLNEIEEPSSVKEKLKDSQGSSAEVITPQPALAFTIDFGDNKEVDTAKYQNLFERYNARHRRNLSTSKVEVKSKKPIPLLSPNLIQKQKAPSTHSEGYFSSDQEDDTKRKADQLSQKLKQLGSKSVSKAQSLAKKTDIMSRSYSEHSSHDQMSQSFHEQLRNIQPSRDKLSLELKHTTSALYRDLQKSVTMNNLSRVERNSFDEEKSNSVKYTPEKKYTKNIEYIEIGHDYGDETNLEQFGEDVNEKVSNLNTLTETRTPNSFISNSVQAVNYSTYNMNTSSVSNITQTEETNLDVFDVSNLDDGSEGAVSEAGTYTVHKDYTDEEKARMDIDKVFGVGLLTQEESSEAYVHSFKMSLSRDSNTWISEWATQVAEHNSLPPPAGGTTGRTPPLSPSKIPSPIHSRSRRLSRGRQEQSDSSLETESLLRAKENISSLPNQHVLIDSGGESDEDTSHSYNTPPHSSQRTPTHSALVRRGSLSEALFRRASATDGRRSARNLSSSEARLKMEQVTTEALKSPSHILARIQLGRRNSSLDRKEYASDTAESNTSRRSSLKNYVDDSPKHTNSPIPNRLRPLTPKLTNSPILVRKEVTTKIINSPILDRTKNLTKSSPQAKNIGYFTCTENSPYMLRKSNSTTNYHEDATIHRVLNNGKELSTTTMSLLQNSPIHQRGVNIQRSSSNASMRNPKLTGLLGRRSSFNTSDSDRASASVRSRFAVASDSSSEAGEIPSKSTAPPISSGIKLNRAFSIRRARLNCESDTTPNTTPEERRRKAQIEVKSAPSSARQPSHYRGRTSSVGANSKEIFKKPEQLKPRAPSVSRTDSGRFSMRAPKSSNHHTPLQRPSQKMGKDHKKPGRSNSTLTSKEVEFQNWKRRKNYDPMKAAAEGKKKLDTSKKHHSIEDSPSRDNSVLRSASFHGTGGALTLAADWSDNEVDIPNDDVRPPPPCSPQLGSDSDLETSSYLRATENVVSAMSARMTVRHSPLVDSGGESDEDTSHSLHHPANRVVHPSQASDTESSDEPQPVVQCPITNTKYNRAFSLRRARLEPQEMKVTSTTPTKVKALPRDVRGKSEPTSTIARTDSGRFSMRLPKSSNMASKAKPKEIKKPIIPNAKEMEMQNWKRRKSYDPMKAAMEGRRKADLAKRNPNANMSPSHVLRSQSFHGSVGLGVSDWSDEELTVSADEASLY